MLELTAELSTKPDLPQAPNFLIDQIQAADSTSKVIKELVKNGTLDPNNPFHRPVIETDVLMLRRGLCLPCASGVAINEIKHYRLIGDRKGPLTIADIFRFLLPHHGKYGRELSLPNGWLVTTAQGDMYHHAIAAFASAVGIDAYSYQGFGSFRDFKPVLDQGGSVAVSLNNRFVIEQTLKPYPDSVKKNGDQILIKVIGPTGLEYRPFQDGRHVVTVLNLDNSQAILADSFNLPQTKTSSGLVVQLPVEEADKYLKYHDKAETRAIIFMKHDKKPLLENISSPLVPPQVSSDLTIQIAKRLNPQKQRL